MTSRNLKPGDRLRARESYSGHADIGEIFTVEEVDDKFMVLDHCKCGSFHARPFPARVNDNEYAWCLDYLSGFEILFSEPALTPEELAQAKSLPSAEEALAFMRRKP